MKVGFYNNNFIKQNSNSNNYASCKSVHNSGCLHTDIFIKNQNISFKGDISSLNSDLRDALKKGNLKAANFLLKRGADPNNNKYYGYSDFTSGWTMIMFAIDPDPNFNKKPKTELIKLLLENGANPNQQKSDGMTALMYSVDDYEITELLLENKANPNIADNNSKTALMEAAAHGNVDIIKLLLEKGADPNLINENGETALSHVLKTSQNDEISIDKIKALIEGGANPNLENKYGKTPLFDAVRNEYRPEIVHALIQCGADPNWQDNQGITPLMFATDTYTLKALLAEGADPTIEDIEGDSAYSLAKELGKSEFVKIMTNYIEKKKRSEELINDLKNIVEISPFEFSIPKINVILSQAEAKDVSNIRFKDNNNSTLLHLLAARNPIYAEPRNEQLNIISYLIKLGADINAKDDNGNTPLSISEKNGNTLLAAFLIENGANPVLKENKEILTTEKNNPETINVTVSAEKTNDKPENIISSNDNLNMAKIMELLSNPEVKELVNTKFKDQNATLLQILSKRKNDDKNQKAEQLNLISYLINLGADINAQDENGNTSLHFAALKGDEDLVKLLLKNGADQNLENKFNCKPLFYAERGTYTGIVKLLQDNKE